MSDNVMQTSFAGGELSPTMYARVDLAKYHIGLALALNFFVDYRGGVSNRPGLQTVCRCKDSINPERLIPFQFSVLQNYMLEFSNLAMRVVKNGAQVLNTVKTIIGITNANPGVVNVTAHGYAAGAQVYFLVAGMTQLNAKNYFVVVVDANHFSLVDWNGAPLNTAGFGVFTSGTVASVYEAVSPYAAADLAMLKFTQSADTMTICHPSYPSYELTRTGDAAWTFIQTVIGTTATAPGAPTAVVTPATVGTTNYSYVITSVNAAGQESQAGPAGGSTLNIDIRTTAGSVALSWAAVPGAVSYNVYKALQTTGSSIPAGVLYGFMTSVTTNAAVDANIVPNFAFSPPLGTNPFTAGNNPVTVTYAQQRKTFMGSTALPQTFWMSKPGQFNNFDVSNPVQPSDSITATLVSRQVNNIKYAVQMPGGLIILTGGGAWQVSGGSAGAVLEPSTITAVPQAYNGCADVEPLTVNEEILYVQQKGTVVRALSYNLYANIYTGLDVSIMSNHLLTGHQIAQWTYAEEPFKIIWAIRDDGALLSFTYLKEQQISGWAQHQTQGRFQSISSIQEGQENAVYAIVQRMVQGQLVSFIERMHTRQMPYGSEDAFFVDAGLSTTQAPMNATLIVSAASGNGVTFTIDQPLFSSGNVGNIIRAGRGIATIVTFIDTKNVICNITRPILDVDNFHDPVVVWPQKSNTWSMDTPKTVFSGLDYLEGETVAVLGDGNVFAQEKVLNGAITLSQPCTKVSVGLPYKARMKTLYLDIGSSEKSVQGKRKNISAMTARVVDTRGIEMGDSFDDLIAYKDRDLNTIGQPIELFTGDQRMSLGGGWQVEGQVCIEQMNPLPATILGIIPEIQIGDDGE